MWIGGADCTGPCIRIVQLDIIELGMFDSKQKAKYLWCQAPGHRAASVSRPARSSTPCSELHLQDFETASAWVSPDFSKTNGQLGRWLGPGLEHGLSTIAPSSRRSSKNANVVVVAAFHSLNHYHGQWCGRSWAPSCGGCFETVDDVCHWSKNECVHVFGVWLFAFVCLDVPLSM